MQCLFIAGIQSNGSSQIEVGSDGKPIISLSGSSNIFMHLEHFPGTRYKRVLSGKHQAKSPKLDFSPDIIFNEITDPDSHSVALLNCKKLISAQGKPVVNHPDAILGTTRDLISANLSGITGLKMPLTVRIKPRNPEQVEAAINASKLSYPVIFRQAGDHGGVSTTLIQSSDEIVELMNSYALDGRSFYLTQFTDYASNDGLYRKYRLVIVGNSLFLRHLIISDKWLIHANSRVFMAGKPALQQEEEQTLKSFATLLGPKLIKTISQISARLKLDYYGIDCSINQQGEILAFEVNANMNILINPAPAPNIWEPPIAAMKDAISKLIVQRAGIVSK